MSTDKTEFLGQRVAKELARTAILQVCNWILIKDTHNDNLYL